jgi:hypothetical protein
MINRRSLYWLLCCLLFIQCGSETNSDNKKSEATQSVLVSDSLIYSSIIVKEHQQVIQQALQQPIPVIRLNTTDSSIAEAQRIALNHAPFVRFVFDSVQHKALRNEIFNVYPARPQEIPAQFQQGKIYKVEMYNYAYNLTQTAFVDLATTQVIQVATLKESQPDIPTHLKNMAIQLAIHHPEVIKALGYKPGEEEALMANTKTGLNNTRCERSMHLCVAPTFTLKDKALWTIVDLTDLKVVGIRWTHTGKEQPTRALTEKRLTFDKIMECYCQQISHLKKQDWELDYVITTSDGLRISDVTYKGKKVVANAKVVDWHVSYSNTDGFGYSDAVGCPEYSQAAVVAVTEPRISDIIENNTIIGFAIEQNFSSEQWPMPCNYNYLQRFEFYTDGRFRTAAASLGRGCGNNGTYRPVFRIAFPGETNSFSEWNGNDWEVWKKEQWKLLTSQSANYSNNYQYAVSDAGQSGYYIETGKGQFGDGGRGDNPFVYVTRLHADKEEGEKDLVSIGPCCNTDYQQGPEKFINEESIEKAPLVLWYVCQMKNDNTPGKEYCWSERYLENGVYKTRVYPCLGGPMFVPKK